MKKIGILGTGIVGKTIGSKLIQLGYEVKMGSRTATNEKAIAWAKANGNKALTGTFADVATFDEIVFNCTKGEVTLEVFKQAGIENFDGKTIIDISNPLDFSQGMPPILAPQYSNSNSLGEEVQKLLPNAYVVKTLNIVNCEVMVEATKSGGVPTMFVCGNNADAKEAVQGILNQFGWTDIMDLGDISTARGTEMMLPIWLRIYLSTQNGYFGFKVIR
ncbi:NADPH-dependent F420 reductase [Emticicia sp. BO119]|uniref:NADPH-dependent F420 reductase n=1 Tax=Emticicia sp. BO119 TaxID=2757768 RepID=UPI0015F08D56|nr:NAD(P)-binding domain-containing protein [Emticicia sp. BO119]MBA4853175.1 NAD(P)-binding domain-containing protein [Emticicia sp. BO119]